MDSGGVGEVVEGIEAIAGVEASEIAAQDERAATRADEGLGPDPLQGLEARIREENRPELAFDRAVIEAALNLEVDDGAGFAQLKRSLKAAGVGITDWSKAVDRRRRERRAEEDAAAQRRARDAAKREREAQEALEAERAKVRAAEKEGAEAERAAHFGEILVDDVTYFMEPGRVWMEEPGPRGAIKTTTLSNFSAAILADVSEFTSPDARPERAAAVSVILGGGAPRTVEVPQKDFDRMEWVGPLLGARASVGAGRSARDHLRRAVQLLSAPEPRWRYRYTGWTRREGTSIYLHAAGAIGAAEGITADVAPPSPVDRFALPDVPTGDALQWARDQVLELCALEPRAAVMAVVGQAFRAALGEARCSLHVYGGAPGSGKSLLCSFGQGFFGAGFHEDNPPLSWRSGGGDSAVSMNILLAAAGDCAVWIDDLKLSGGTSDQDLMRRADQIFSQVFSGKARTLGRREGGIRANPAPRSVVLSSGEVLPRAGNSLVQRLLPVLYPHRMEGGDVMAVRARNLEGVNAQFMAAFLRWIAPQREKLRATIRDREVRAAEEWGLGSTPRAVKLFGALAVGLRALCAFLREIGTEGDIVDALEARARVALRELSGQYDSVADEQDPVETFVRLLGDCIATGAAHVTTPQGCAPRHCHLFGWSPKSSEGRKSAEGFDEAPSYAPSGKLVGYVNKDLTRLYIRPSAAFATAQRAAREANQVINLDAADLGRRLSERGYLAADEHEANRTYGTRLRVRGEVSRGLLCLKLDAVLPGVSDDGSDLDRGGSKDEPDGFGEPFEDASEGRGDDA